jgi:hypothetical protein
MLGGRRCRTQWFCFDITEFDLISPALTCRANQVHTDTIADIVEPAPETVAGFSFYRTIGQVGFNLSKPFRRIFRNLLTARKRFDMSGKSPA